MPHPSCEPYVEIASAPVEPFDCCARSSFLGDDNGIDAVVGRVVAVFPVLTATGQQRIMAATMRFQPGTLTLQ